MKRKVIIFFSYEFPPVVGGVSTFVRGLVEGLSEESFDVIVIAPKSLRTDAFDKNKDFKVMRIAHSHNVAVTYLLGICNLALMILKLRPHTVFATDILSQRISSFLFPFVSRRLLILAHGSEVLANFREGFLKRWLYTRIYYASKHIIANSNYTKGLLERRHVKSEKITVIYPAIDSHKFSQRGNPQRLRKIFNLNGYKILLTVGSLSERKGHNTVLQALSLVIKQMPNVKYLIVGDGQYALRLKELASSLGLNDYVVFAGRVNDDEIIDYYDVCNIFILPNRIVKNLVEGFGIAFVEASARGKPVIGGDNGGVSDAVINGKTGFLVNPEDTEEIANKIIELLTNERLANEMGQKGRERALKHFDYNIITEKVFNLTSRKK